MKITTIVLICLTLLFAKIGLAQDSEKNKFESVHAVVTADKVNVRAGIGLNFEILGQLDEKNEVLVIGRKYGWYKIKLPKDALSFVHKDYVKNGIVTADKLRIRAGNSLNSNVLGVLKKGEKVNVLSQEGEWLKITPPDNCYGWVKKDYLKLWERRFTPKIPKPATGSEKEKETGIEKENKIEVSGRIDDLGKIFNRQGTHKLVKDGKILYYLKSKYINLNNYVYQNVYVIGALMETENSTYPVIKVEQINYKR